jgi:serine/threonine protein kinase
MHGHSPYRAKKIEDIYDNIVNERMKFSSRISEEVKDLLNKILQIKPSARISIEGILEHSWVKRYSKLQKLKELSSRPESMKEKDSFQKKKKEKKALDLVS